MVGFGPFRNVKGLDDSVAPHRKTHVIGVHSGDFISSGGPMQSKSMRLSFEESLEARGVDFVGGNKIPRKLNLWISCVARLPSEAPRQRTKGSAIAALALPKQLTPAAVRCHIFLRHREKLCQTPDSINAFTLPRIAADMFGGRECLG